VALYAGLIHSTGVTATNVHDSREVSSLRIVKKVGSTATACRSASEQERLKNASWIGDESLLLPLKRLSSAAKIAIAV
jgi:hypothetical protein